MAAAIPVMAVMLIIHGRLVYPNVSVSLELSVPLGRTAL
jgi:hypothetical protein